MSQDSLRRRIQERWEGYNMSVINDPKTITRDQLRDAFEALTEYDERTRKRTFNHSATYHFDQADSVIRWIRKELNKDDDQRTTHNSYLGVSGGNVPVNNPNDTLTVAELDRALRDRGHVSTANDIYRQVVANREPKWETGNIVRSKAGNVFTRLANGDWRNETAPTVVVKDGNIGRPLTLIGQAV